MSARKKPANVISGSEQAVEYIDSAIADIVDSWSMRDEAPDGNCLMSALANLKAARSELTPPRKGPANADGSVSR